MEKSKLRSMALQAAGWGLLHGDFFDLYDVADQLHIPTKLAREVVRYLRYIGHIETMAETRSCKREPGKRSPQRIFIKIVVIRPEPPDLLHLYKLNVLRSHLARLSKVMPSPRGAR